MPQNNKNTGPKKVAQAAIIKKMLMEKLGRYNYEYFIAAIYEAHKSQIIKYIIDDVLYDDERARLTLYEVINYAFCWARSQGGHEFWMEKDSEWREYVSQCLLKPEFNHVFK